MFLNFVATVGRLFLNFVRFLGVNTEIFLQFIVKVVLPPYYFKNFLKEFLEIGFFSLPVVALTALFSGMVLALQTYTSFTLLPSEGVIANVVAVALARELAPVLTALMVAGRIASSAAAEIGTMKVTEQVDALYTLSVNPIKFLIAPKIIAGIICLPLLVFLADIIGIMGGYFVSITKLGFNGDNYINSSYLFLTLYDILSGLVKGAIFGFVLTTVGCIFGYCTKNGAQGVGRSTTSAVVVSAIIIFLSDYLLTMLFFGVR